MDYVFLRSIGEKDDASDGRNKTPKLPISLEYNLSFASVFTRLRRFLRLEVHRVIMRLLEDDILEKRLGIDILQLDTAIRLLLLTNDHTLALGLEQHTTGGDGGGGAVLLLGHTDG